MGLCDILIDADIVRNCEEPFFGGYENIGYIVNKDDIKEYSVYDGVYLESFSLKEGKKAYKIESIGSQPTPTTQTFVKGKYYNKWNTLVNLVLLEHSPDAVNNIISPMASGASFVVLLKHKSNVRFAPEGINGGSGAWEVFGLTKGLTLQDGASREEYNEELDGGWNLPLEENGAPRPSYFISEVLIEDLKTPAV